MRTHEISFERGHATTTRQRAERRRAFYTDPAWWVWALVAIMALIPLKSAFATSYDVAGTATPSFEAQLRSVGMIVGYSRTPAALWSR